jgi:hypothetical protein
MGLVDVRPFLGAREASVRCWLVDSINKKLSSLLLLKTINSQR